MRKDSFIKVMLPGFNTQLDLPLDFCQSAKKHLSEKAEIVTCLGKWKIKVGKQKPEGSFYLHGAGWDAFVEKHNLLHCDCMVFLHRGSFRFNATLYSPSGSIKHLPVPPNPNPKLALHQITSNTTFTRVLSAHSGGDFHSRNSSRFYLPTRIWKYNPDFQYKTKAILRLSGLHTREWRANLVYYHGEDYDRFAVAEGWYDFVCYNGIKKGHCCKFEIIPDASTLGYSNKKIIIIVTKLS